jgi:hypothetical protein
VKHCPLCQTTLIWNNQDTRNTSVALIIQTVLAGPILSRMLLHLRLFPHLGDMVSRQLLPRLSQTNSR